jgi:hypothetical protein
MAPKTETLFSEKAANLEVIASLERQISKLKGVPQMSKVIKSIDGTYYRVHDYEELTEAEVSVEVAALQQELAELESIAPANEAAAASDAPAEPAPTDGTTPPDQLPPSDGSLTLQ